MQGASYDRQPAGYVDGTQMRITPEVLQSAQGGNAADFDRIVLAYRSKVMATVGRMIGRPEDAEDVTQEVFTRLYFMLRNLREPAAFEIWLHRMTVNAAYDYLRGPRGRSNRREARVAELPETQLALMDAVAARRAQLDDREHERVRELVEDLLAALSDADRILMIFREVEGLSLQEIETIYKTNQNALKVRLFRARQRMLKAFHNQRGPRCAEFPALRREFAHNVE
uniref:RNA polymerase, sigma-24 subunit, ECF subfamily n=1 Tax=Solibacter usitatus (strain Ellin6076) TaxID=234267 RepID=Q023E4_SOLUE